MPRAKMVQPVKVGDVVWVPMTVAAAPLDRTVITLHYPYTLSIDGHLREAVTALGAFTEDLWCWDAQARGVSRGE